MRSLYLSVTINANRVEKKKAMVKKRLTIALALLLSFLFKGCSVAPKKVKNPCLKANWSLLGQKVASRGKVKAKTNEEIETNADLDATNMKKINS